MPSGEPPQNHIVDDELAATRDWLPLLAEEIGAEPPRCVPAWLVQILAANDVVMSATRSRGASNAEAKRAFGWTLRYPSWREGYPRPTRPRRNEDHGARVVSGERRTEVMFASEGVDCERIVEHMPAVNIHRISPTPLLVICTTGDWHMPTDIVGAAYARAGEPKRIVRVSDRHYAVYEDLGQREAASAAVDRFRAHLDRQDRSS